MMSSRSRQPKTDQLHRDAIVATGRALPIYGEHEDPIAMLAEAGMLRPSGQGEAGSEASANKRAGRVSIRRGWVRVALSRLTRPQQMHPFSETALDELEKTYEAVRSETIERFPEFKEDLSSRQYRVGRETLIKDVKAILKEAKASSIR